MYGGAMPERGVYVTDRSVASLTVTADVLFIPENYSRVWLFIENDPDASIPLEINFGDFSNDLIYHIELLPAGHILFNKDFPWSGAMYYYLPAALGGHIIAYEAIAL